jgi:ABC-type uncharacterized transport system substrate-binding protein
MSNAQAHAIAELARRRLMSSIGTPEFALAGGLIGYGVNVVELYRRAAHFVDRIAKGAKPSDLPVERATRFDLVINRRAADALALLFPNSLLPRADQRVEWAEPPGLARFHGC